MLCVLPYAACAYRASRAEACMCPGVIGQAPRHSPPCHWAPTPPLKAGNTWAAAGRPDTAAGARGPRSFAPLLSREAARCLRRIRAGLAGCRGRTALQRGKGLRAAGRPRGRESRGHPHSRPSTATLSASHRGGFRGAPRNPGGSARFDGAGWRGTGAGAHQTPARASPPPCPASPFPARPGCSHAVAALSPPGPRALHRGGGQRPAGRGGRARSRTRRHQWGCGLSAPHRPPSDATPVPLPASPKPLMSSVKTPGSLSMRHHSPALLPADMAAARALPHGSAPPPTDRLSCQAEARRSLPGRPRGPRRACHLYGEARAGAGSGGGDWIRGSRPLPGVAPPRPLRGRTHLRPTAPLLWRRVRENPCTALGSGSGWSARLHPGTSSAAAGGGGRGPIRVPGMLSGRRRGGVGLGCGRRGASGGRSGTRPACPLPRARSRFRHRPPSQVSSFPRRGSSPGAAPPLGVGGRAGPAPRPLPGRGLAGKSRLPRDR